MEKVTTQCTKIDACIVLPFMTTLFWDHPLGLASVTKISSNKENQWQNIIISLTFQILSDEGDAVFFTIPSQIHPVAI